MLPKRHRSVEQNRENRIEKTEIATYTCGQLIFNRGAKIIEQSLPQILGEPLDIHNKKNEPQPKP